MVSSHHVVHACPCLSCGVTNAQSDNGGQFREVAGKKTLATHPVSYPLTDDESLQATERAHLPVMVPLSIPELRRLFFYLLSRPPLSPLFRLGWSFFLRTHQAIARRCHYQRCLTAAR
jgi:hypothetical protein